MSFFTLINVSALVACALVAPRANAQATVRAITTVGGGASDNARGVPDHEQKHNRTVFGRTRLTLDLGYEAPLASHRLVYVIGATAYPDNVSGNNISQEALLESTFTWSRATLELDATGSHSLLNDMEPIVESPVLSPNDPDPVGPAAPELPQPTDEVGPVGTVGFLGGSLAESLGIDLSPNWALYQSAELDAFSTLIGGHVDPPIWVVGHDLGLERSWVRDAGRVEASVGYESAPQLIDQTSVIPAAQGELGRTGLGWAHQLSRAFRSDLSGGAFAARASLDEPFHYGPYWRGSLAWKGQLFRGVASYDHSARPSVVLGGIFLTDRVTVRGTGRFGPDERYRFSSSVRWQRLRPLSLSAVPDLISPDYDPAGSVTIEEMGHVADRIQAQITVAGRPWPRRFIEIGLSYRVTSQNGAILGRRQLRTFDRNVVLLTLSIGFPMVGG